MDPQTQQGLAPDVLGALRQTADRIETLVDGIAEDITEVLHREVSELPDDPQTRRDTWRASRELIRAFLRSLRSGQSLEPVEPIPEALAAARGRARAGLGLLPLLRLTHLGHGAFLASWEGELTQLDLPAETLLATMVASQQLSFSYADGMARRLGEAYEDERRLLTRTGDAQRAEAIRAILAGTGHDPDALGRTLGHDLRRHHVGLVLWTTGGVEEVELTVPLEEAAADVAAALGAGRPLLMWDARAVLAAWVSVPDADAAVAAIETLAGQPRADRVSVAIGVPAFGLAGFRSTHRDAEDAFRVALTAGRRLGSVVPFRRVELAALLSDDLQRARRFVDGHLGPLAVDDDEHGRLRSTLRVYLEENGSRVAVARRLGIHANTVGNRVRACEELLGGELPERRVELHVALALAQTLGSSVLRPGAVT
ncbi:MAG: helix-turn-helix domain-containing protein [Solirubrobacteraceae bacterium]|nr:helix-turn-helix domain-containing protein [Solirubrobacteraceae bacterium]